MGVLAFGDADIDGEMANDEATAELLDAEMASRMASVVEAGE
jgi:hypothetical protein